MEPVTEEGDWPEWRAWLRRWDAVIAGLRGRPGFDDTYLDETHFEGVQEPFLGIGSLLGGHEQGMHELTPEEEDELWDLAAEEECSDDDLMNRWVREKSVRNRPIRTVRPKRPLTGGGHGPGRGVAGKREFPGTWSDDEAIRHTMDVARHPSGAVELPSKDFRGYGEREGVQLSVVVARDGSVRTSYPVSGPGVVDNPLDHWRAPHVARLQEVLDVLVPAGDGEPRVSLDELMAVGEWPHVIACLLALGPDDAHRTELEGLARLAGLAT